MLRSSDSQKHHRRSIRLRGWDYRSAGYYFVTICTHQRINLFGNVIVGDMHLNDFGHIANNAWQAIPTHVQFTHVQLMEWIVMPNHIHGIVVIVDDLSQIKGETAGRGRDSSFEASVPVGPSQQQINSPIPFDDEPLPFRNAEAGSLGVIVGSFKSLVSRRINNVRRMKGAPVWQRGHYERIIRNERELNAIWQYIEQNPMRWQEDRENLDDLFAKMHYVP